MTPAKAIEILTEVMERWEDLIESRLVGTSRPWRQTEMSEEAQERRDYQARIEKAEAERNGRAPGFSPAPLHVDVLDTMSTIVMTADLLHEHVAQTVGHPRLDHAPSAYADPTPYLRYIIEILPEACDGDPDMLEAALDKAEIMRSAIRISLGEVYDGQTLNAICPFCVGRTYRKPAGERTLRIRIIPDRKSQDPDVTEVVVSCENPDGCQPFANECGLWVKGKPSWRWPEWEWLAQRLIPTRAA